VTIQDDRVTSSPGDAPAPGRSASLAFLAIAEVLAMSTWFSGTAVIGSLRTLWALSPGQSAWLTIAVQLGFVAGAIVFAITNVVDVFSPRRVFAIASLLAALVNGLLIYANGPAIAIPLRFLTGFFLVGVYPPALKILATWFVKDRGLALGVLVGAASVGSAAPHLVNGLGGLEWHAVVLWSSAFTALGGVLVLLLVRDGPFPFPSATFDPRQAGRVLHDRGVRLACLGYFGHMWELYAMWAWFLVFMTDSLRHSGIAEAPRLGSLATFVVIASGFFGCAVAGRLGDRWGRTKVTTFSMVISGACALVIGALVAASPWLVFALGVVWGISVVADSGQFSTMVTELADPAYVGTALTLQLGIGFTLTVATIWLVPIVRDAAGWWWAFALLVPGPLLGIVAMARLARLPEAKRIAGGRG